MRRALQTFIAWLESAALRPDVTAAPRCRRRSRRAPLRVLGLAIAAAAVASLILAPEASANFFTPKSGGSKNVVTSSVGSMSGGRFHPYHRAIATSLNDLVFDSSPGTEKTPFS